MITRQRISEVRRGGGLWRAVSPSVFLAAGVLAGTGCMVEGDETADPLGESFAEGELAGFCAAEGSDAGHGVLALVNDPRVNKAVLDDPVSTGNVGLNRTAAEGIVERRPFASLADLDAVPFVGLSACGALREFACEVRSLCERPLVTLSWNVEQFPLGDETLEEVAREIERLDPDVIGFQEIRDVDAFDRLLDRLGSYEAHAGRGDGFTRVAVATHVDRIQVDSIGDLFSTDRNAFPRAPVMAELTARAGSFEVSFDFTDLHLKSSNDATSRERRRAAIESLRALIDDREAAGRSDAILVGDWNDRLTDIGDLNVFELFLDEPDRFSFLTQPIADAGGFSFVPSLSLIDHVLAVGGDTGSLVPRDTQVVRLDQTVPDYVERISDHLPVLSRFTLRPDVD
jgi:endonuclease/exonuclease/phosphatase family metal-dependent hydrolase